MICRRVTSLTSYVCVDIVTVTLTVNPGRLSFGEAYLYENENIIIIIIRLFAILSIIQYSIPFLSLPVVSST
jgi:hypothetical protein